MKKIIVYVLTFSLIFNVNCFNAINILYANINLIDEVNINLDDSYINDNLELNINELIDEENVEEILVEEENNIKTENNTEIENIEIEDTNKTNQYEEEPEEDVETTVELEETTSIEESEENNIEEEIENIEQKESTQENEDNKIEEIETEEIESTKKVEETEKTEEIIEETNETENNQIVEETNKASNSEIEEITIVEKESETSEKIATNSDVIIEKEELATESEIGKIEELPEDIFKEILKEISKATISDLIINEGITNINNKNIATLSEVVIGELDTYGKLLADHENAAVLNENTITLTKDIKLNETLKFDGKYNLDLAGHTIEGPDNGNAITVVNNFILNDTSLEKTGIIKSVNPLYEAFYIVDSLVEFIGGEVLGAYGGGNALRVINSDLIVSGARIIGGEGESFDDKVGGDGGDAIVYSSEDNDNSIYILDGKVSGGNGGSGKGNEEPVFGSALTVGIIDYSSEYFVKGAKGTKGGGNGGKALYIQNEDFNEKNLFYENKILREGSGGQGKQPLLLRNMFGNATESKYTLNNVDGKNYLTSLKTQGSTTLCISYATIASAETYMIKNYPEYVKALGYDVDKTLDLNTWESNDNEFDLSELHFGMSLYIQPKDEFGNAGYSESLLDSAKESWWESGGATEDMFACNLSTWRALVLEDEALEERGWEQELSSDFINQYTNKTAVHAKNIKLYSYQDYTSKTKFITDMKNQIKENAGVCIGIHYTDVARIPSGEYANSLVYCTRREVSSSEVKGHEMFAIGWDDSVPKEYFATSDYTPTINGAIILKDSYNRISLVSYDNFWEVNVDSDEEAEYFSHFVAIEWVPAFSEFENNYFYDSGLSPLTIGTTTLELDHDMKEQGYKLMATLDFTSLFVPFNIKNEKEKITGISYYSKVAQELILTLYKLDDIEISTIQNLKDEDIIYTKNINVHRGSNVINIDEDLEVYAGDNIGVKITNAKGTGLEKIPIDMSKTYDSVFDFKSVLANKSYLIDLGEASEIRILRYSDGKILDATNDEALVNQLNIQKLKQNLRIKLHTNNYVTLDAVNGTFSDNNDINYYYPSLKGNMVNMPESNSKNANYIFKSYNTKEDGSGETYSSESIYKMDIAKTLKLFAQYEEIAEDKKSVTFITEYGNIPETQIVDINTKATEPAKLTATGYTFEYWYKDNENEKFDFSNELITENIKLTAKWIENVYAVSYNLNDGNWNSGFNPIGSREYTTSITLPTSKNLLREGYTFVGWYDNSSFEGEAILTISANTSADKVLYAKWKKNESSSGGSSSSGESSSGGSSNSGSSSSGSSSGGSSGGGGGGSSGSGGTVTFGALAGPFGENDSAKQVNKKSISGTAQNVSFFSEVGVWSKDAFGKWQLVGTNLYTGEPEVAKNNFYCISKLVDFGEETINVFDFYYFDQNGQMYTGWLNTGDGKQYFFNTVETHEEGKMARGWTEIAGKYYYFNLDGTLFKGGITPDGYLVDMSGAWYDPTNPDQGGYVSNSLGPAIGLFANNSQNSLSNSSPKKETNTNYIVEPVASKNNYVLHNGGNIDAPLASNNQNIYDSYTGNVDGPSATNQDIYDSYTGNIDTPSATNQDIYDSYTGNIDTKKSFANENDKFYDTPIDNGSKINFITKLLSSFKGNKEESKEPGDNITNNQNGDNTIYQNENSNTPLSDRYNVWVNTLLNSFKNKNVDTLGPGENIFGTNKMPQNVFSSVDQNNTNINTDANVKESDKIANMLNSLKNNKNINDENIDNIIEPTKNSNTNYLDSSNKGPGHNIFGAKNNAVASANEQNVANIENQNNIANNSQYEESENTKLNRTLNILNKIKLDSGNVVENSNATQDIPYDNQGIKRYSTKGIVSATNNTQ